MCGVFEDSGMGLVRGLVDIIRLGSYAGPLLVVSCPSLRVRASSAVSRILERVRYENSLTVLRCL